MAGSRGTPDWKGWLDRWDEQQESFNPRREERFGMMFDVLEATLSRRFRVLDLGSGPGSLAARLVRRFPTARVVAVDYDPVVLRVGREALRPLRRRIAWIDADLGAPDWIGKLPLRRFDAALSTTALHWLRPARLRALYRDLGRLIRPGGVLLNGDYLPWGPDRPKLRAVAERVRKTRFAGASIRSEWAGWNRWWRDIEREPALRAEFRERRARFAKPHGQSGEPSVEVHERALRQAGFREVAVIWQDFENRVVLGLR